jgi:hypothetical protein
MHIYTYITIFTHRHTQVYVNEIYRVRPRIMQPSSRRFTHTNCVHTHKTQLNVCLRSRVIHVMFFFLCAFDMHRFTYQHIYTNKYNTVAHKAHTHVHINNLNLSLLCIKSRNHHTSIINTHIATTPPPHTKARTRTSHMHT